MPFGELIRRKEFIFDTLSWDVFEHKVFIRPDSGNKTFTGRNLFSGSVMVAQLTLTQLVFVQIEAGELIPR